MSNSVSVLVYSRRIGSPLRKAVMVYFAERASDDGEGIWASKATMAAHIECGRSSVIRAINEFVSEGLLRIVGTRPHRNGETTEYAMNLDAIAALPGAKEAQDNQSRTDTSPAVALVPDANQSRSGTQPVPQRDTYQSRSGTQTILRTTKEPPESKAREAQDVLCEWAGTEAVTSFLAYRRKSKVGSLTLTAAKRLATHLKAIFDGGGDTDDALGMAEERGWRTVESAWYFNEKGKSNDNRSSASGTPRRSGMVDAFAAVAAQRSGRA